MAHHLTSYMDSEFGKSIKLLNTMSVDVALRELTLRAVALSVEALRRGNKLLFAGNGGSAADAQHWAGELVSRFNFDRPGLAGIALTTDTSILTAIGNDYSYDNVFERQIEALGIAGDVLLAISTSGNSKNCVKALRLARHLGIHTVSYTGNGGGAMKALSDINVIVPSNITMNIQESHLALEHIFCMLVERIYFGPNFDKAPQHLSE